MRRRYGFWPALGVAVLDLARDGARTGIGVTAAVIGRVAIPTIFALSAWVAGLPKPLSDLVPLGQKNTVNLLFGVAIVAGAIVVAWNTVVDVMGRSRLQRDVLKLLKLPLFERSLEEQTDLGYLICHMADADLLDGDKVAATLSEVAKAAAVATSAGAAILSSWDAKRNLKIVSAFYRLGWHSTTPGPGTIDHLGVAFQPTNTYLTQRNGITGLGVLVFRSGQPWGILHVEMLSGLQQVEEVAVKAELRVLKTLANLVSFLFERMMLIQVKRRLSLGGPGKP